MPNMTPRRILPCAILKKTVTSRKCVSLIILVAVAMTMVTFFDILKPSYKETVEKQCRGSLISVHGNRKAHNVRYLIDTCMIQDQCFKWGEKQRAIVTTYLISLLSNRTYGIYITSSCQLEQFLVPNKVNWIINKSDLDGFCASDFFMYFDEAQNYRQHKMIENADFDKMFREDIIFIHTAQDYVAAIRRHKLTSTVIPWLHSFTIGRVYHYILRHMFMLSNNTRQTVTNILHKHVNDSKLVCTHVRIGNPWSKEAITTQSELETIWDFLQRYKDVSKYKLYVATDENETIAKAKELFSNQIFDIEGSIDQIERSRSCDAFRKVILEQEILKRCDTFLLTRSSLGIIAAYMRNTNMGLYCYFKNRVFPCTMETLHELYDHAL